MGKEIERLKKRYDARKKAHDKLFKKALKSKNPRNYRKELDNIVRQLNSLTVKILFARQKIMAKKRKK